MYKEWVPAGKLVKSLVGFVSLVFAFVLLVVAVNAKHTVLIDLEALLLRHPAQHDVVLLGAGEVL